MNTIKILRDFYQKIVLHSGSWYGQSETMSRVIISDRVLQSRDNKSFTEKNSECAIEQRSGQLNQNVIY